MAAQVQQVEGSMSELASELELAAAQAQGNSRAEQYKLQEQQREKQMGILEGDLKGLVTGEQLQQVEERMGELEEWAGKQLQEGERWYCKTRCGRGEAPCVQGVLGVGNVGGGGVKEVCDGSSAARETGEQLQGVGARGGWPWPLGRWPWR